MIEPTEPHDEFGRPILEKNHDDYKHSFSLTNIERDFISYAIQELRGDIPQQYKKEVPSKIMKKLYREL